MDKGSYSFTELLTVYDYIQLQGMPQLFSEGIGEIIE